MYAAGTFDIYILALTGYRRSNTLRAVIQAYPDPPFKVEVAKTTMISIWSSTSWISDPTKGLAAPSEVTGPVLAVRDRILEGRVSLALDRRQARCLLGIRDGSITHVQSKRGSTCVCGKTMTIGDLSLAVTGRRSISSRGMSSRNI